MIRDDSILTFHEGLPSDDILENPQNDNLCLVLDDLLETAFRSDLVSSIFTTGRQRNVSIILLSHNLFPPYSKSRTISLNANYIILFRNLRDKISLRHLTRQVMPEHSKSFCQLFINNISKPFSHLLFDFSSKGKDFLRYRENILDNFPIIYSDEETIEKDAERIQAGEEIFGFAF